MSRRSLADREARKQGVQGATPNRRSLLGALPPSASLIEPSDPRLNDNGSLITVMHNTYPTYYAAWNKSGQPAQMTDTFYTI